MFVEGSLFRKSTMSLGSNQHRISCAISIPVALAVTNRRGSGIRGLPRPPEPSPDVAVGTSLLARDGNHHGHLVWPPSLTFLPSLLCSLRGCKGSGPWLWLAGGQDEARQSFPWQASPRPQPSVIYGTLCRFINKIDY